MQIDDLPTGHVLRISEASYHRLFGELQRRIDEPHSTGEEISGSRTFFGTHSDHGEISLSCIEAPASHPDRPTYQMIILGYAGDEERIAQTRSELEIDDF